MKIYNFTQHDLTEEQRNDGIQELPAECCLPLRALLGFQTLPTQEEVYNRAEQIAELAAQIGATGVMLGGAPFLMPPLYASLKKRGIRVFFAFSQRRSKEVHTESHTVEKCSVFSYEGLVEL